VLRGNRINKNGFQAVSIRKTVAGTIEDNDLRDNRKGLGMFPRATNLAS